MHAHTLYKICIRVLRKNATYCVIIFFMYNNRNNDVKLSFENRALLLL